MPELCVIADDLTGAFETGAQFAKLGIPTWMQFDSPFSALRPTGECEVLVVNTESRHVDPEGAARRVYSVARNALDSGIEYIYKKTDSTLRGNIGAELEALLHATGIPRIAFIPAYPKANRYTIGGLQYIGDTPIHQTSIGEDPLDPKTTSSIVEILGSQTQINIHTVDLDRQPAWPVPTGSGMMVFDCHGDQNLLKIGLYVRDTNQLNITAGSSGFAEQLPDLMEMKKRRVVAPVERRPLLVLNGSLSDVSLCQARYAREIGFNDVVIPSSVLFEKAEVSGYVGATMADKVADHLGSHKCVLLRTILQRSDLLGYFEQSRMDVRFQKHMYLSAADNMGILIREVLNRFADFTLVVFGGDTLRGVLTTLELEGLKLIDEIVTGVAVARYEWKDTHLYLVSKSGSFGQKDIIKEILGYFNPGTYE